MSLSRLDLSNMALPKGGRSGGQAAEPPSMYSAPLRARTALMPLKGESMISLHVKQNMSPYVFPQSPDGLVKDPSKETAFRRSKSVATGRRAATAAAAMRPLTTGHPAHVFQRIVPKPADSDHGRPLHTDREPAIAPRPRTVFDRHRRPKTGRLVSARLSTYLGKHDPKRPLDTSSNLDHNQQEGIYSLLDRGLIPHGSDYTNHIKLLAESALSAKRAVTVHAPYSRQMFEPLFATSAEQPVRARTAGRSTMAQSQLNADIQRLKQDLLVSFEPAQGRGWHDRSSHDVTRGAPTPCPTDAVVPALPSMRSRRFARLGPSEPPQTFTTPNKQFVISMGRIVRESEAFVHFLALAGSLSVSEPLVMFMIDKIEAFCAGYMVRWGEVSYQKLLDLINRPDIALRVSDEDIVSVMANDVEVQTECARPGQRYRGSGGRLAAIIKIQSTWRMITLRRIHQEFVGKLRAGERFRQKWLIRHKIKAIQASREKRHLDHLKRHHILREALRAEWPLLKTKKRVIIHLPSMSFDTLTRTKYENMQKWQIRQLGRLVDLMDPNVSIVYVTPLLVGEVEKFFKQAVGYCFDISDLVRSKRLFILSLKRPEFCKESVSLSAILMCTPLAIRKIATFIRDTPAYMVPAVCGRFEVEIAHMLGIPILGSYEGSTEYAHSHTAQRRLIRQSFAPHAPGSNKFKTEEQLYAQLEELIKKYPKITRWLFKIDGEMECRGLAYFDVKDLLTEDAAAKEEDEVADPATETLRLISSAVAECEHPFHDKLYTCVHFCRKGLWTSWNHFLRCLLVTGGVIEACAPDSDLETNSTEYPVVHLVIEPDHKVRILSTSSQNDLFASVQDLGCDIPSAVGDHRKLVSYIDLIGRECVQRGIIGHVTCEFVAWRLEDMFEYTIWCTAVKPYFTENLMQAYYALFMSSCQTLHSDGKMYFNLNVARRLNLRYISKVPYVDMDQVKRVTHTERVDDEIDNEERVCIYTTRIFHQNFEVMDVKMFNGLCIESGITYDSKWKFGTQLPMFEDFTKQNYAMMCINRSLETVLEMMLQNIVIIARRMTGSIPAYSNFMEVSQYLCKVLANVRPYSYIHKPSVTKGIARLSDLEVVLNKYMTLPLSRMAGFMAGDENTPAKAKDNKSSKRGMSSTTINLLNAGIPSKTLSGFYPDFGREKVDQAGQNRVHSSTRVPPGLPMDEYMAIMEHLAGLDNDNAAGGGGTDGETESVAALPAIAPTQPRYGIARRASATGAGMLGMLGLGSNMSLAGGAQLAAPASAPAGGSMINLSGHVGGGGSTRMGSTMSINTASASQGVPPSPRSGRSARGSPLSFGITAVSSVPSSPSGSQTLAPSTLASQGKSGLSTHASGPAAAASHGLGSAGRPSQMQRPSPLAQPPQNASEGDGPATVPPKDEPASLDNESESAKILHVTQQ
ncbi:hypothetical protein BC831DRAFT_450714 [Entophlyctis helioformis]|nr:hypothetical protein BC831DRAFT_450714 [Entophlyctis helioformis]